MVYSAGEGRACWFSGLLDQLWKGSVALVSALREPVSRGSVWEVKVCLPLLCRERGQGLREGKCEADKGDSEEVQREGASPRAQPAQACESSVEVPEI